MGLRSWIGAADLKLNARYQHNILCKDPFAPTDPGVDELLSAG